MAAVGGSVESVSIGTRRFAVAADADLKRALGGFSNEVQANGDGTARIVKKREPWKVSGVKVQCDDVIADHEYLQGLQDGRAFVDVVVTLASGETYSGQGIPTDLSEVSTMDQTCELTLSGPQKLRQQ